MANIKDEQMQVLIKCIGAAETGGQVYGNCKYDCYVNAYTNSSLEDSITLGAFQEFKEGAKALLQEIKDAHPTTFAKYDTANIASDLKKSSWSGYNPAKTSEKAKAIINIIGSSDGIKVQDKRVARLLKQHIDYAESLGVEDVDALFMCANFIHHGGNSACKRIIGKTKKPYTLDNLYSACKTDTGNQVGAYKSRQKFIYDALKKYISNNKEEKPTMAINYEKYINNKDVHYISNSGSDERGKYNSGVAGDQTGTEWQLRTWYNRPWDCVLRHPNANVRKLLAELGIEAALNNLIGYDQYQRDTYWQHLKASNYRPSQITIACESDCSAGVIANTKAVGYILGLSKLQNISATYTGNMKAGFKSAGFEVLTDSKYVNGYDYLLEGDILLNESHHTATNITRGSKVSGSYTNTTTPSTPSTSTPSSGKTLNETTKWVGIVNVSSDDVLNVRTWASASSSKCSFSPLHKGDEVDVCDTQKASDGVDWYYIKYNNKYGFVHSAYVKKKATTSKPQQTDNKVDFAESKNSAFSGKYTTIANLNIRISAGTSEKDKVITTIPKGKTVVCYGYYTNVNGTNWYLVQYGDITGFVSSKYLNK